MSKSLRIENGDLAIGVGRSYDLVSGKDKLSQDLKLWILERIGQDPSAPQYGSRLDGGAQDGVEIDSFIGQVATQERILEIKAELINLLNFYQNTQLEKMKREVVLYSGKHTLAEDEVLHTVDKIEATQMGTAIIVRITITTLSGSSLQITIPQQV